MSEGAPIGYLWWAMPARLHAAGLEAGTIGPLVGSLALPWGLKFLWAPLVDAARGPRWSLRSWIVACQAVMGLTLLPLGWLDLRADLALACAFLYLHAFAAATQDAAVDAWAIAALEPGERAAANGWMQAGMLLGRSLFGGGAMLLAGLAGEEAVVLLLVGAVWWSLSLVALAGEGPEEAPVGPPSARWRAFRSAAVEALRGRRTWLGLGLALTAGAGFEALGALASPFLLDSGVERRTVAWFLFLPAVGAMLAGSLAAGPLIGGRNRVRAVAAFVVLTAAAVVAAAWAGDKTRLAALSGVYLSLGLLTAASYALFMDLTDRRLAGTQFSAYMGATNLCEAASASAAGRLAGAWGYPPAFTVMALLSLLSLPILKALDRPGGTRRGRRGP